MLTNTQIQKYMYDWLCGVSTWNFKILKTTTINKYAGIIRDTTILLFMETSYDKIVTKTHSCDYVFCFLCFA